MQKRRPAFIGFVVLYFFTWHVAWDLGVLLGSVIELGEAFAKGGYSAFKSVYNVKLRDFAFFNLLRAIGVQILLFGLWGMRRWALYLFTLYVGWYLWLLVSGPHFPVRTIAIVSCLLLGTWFFFDRKPKRSKKVEKPQTHLYEGPTTRASHEPKSAVEDLIY